MWEFCKFMWGNNLVNFLHFYFLSIFFCKKTFSVPSRSHFCKFKNGNFAARKAPLFMVLAGQIVLLLATLKFILLMKIENVRGCFINIENRIMKIFKHFVDCEELETSHLKCVSRGIKALKRGKSLNTMFSRVLRLQNILWILYYTLRDEPGEF